MTSFTSASLKLIRRLIQHAPDRETVPSDSATILDGISAVTATERRISEAASLSATFPAASGALQWSRYSDQHFLNQFGKPLGLVPADNPRAAVAGALGLSMSGLRAIAFLSGPDLLTAQDLLSIAAGHHLPLVIHLVCRAAHGHAQALGSGHEAYHAASERGFFQLFATNVQEAVDFALIARRVAELSLVPGIVAMDAEQTAAAAQDVLLPSEELVSQYLADPSQLIKSPTDAQRLIYGESRRRVPKSFDIDKPAMLSPLQGPESFALGSAGQRTYYCDHLQANLVDAFDEFAALTGRRYDPVLTHEVSKADILFIAQGSAVETLAAFADHARKQMNLKVGVLGLRSLRPLPAAQIVRHLAGSKVAAVFERVDTPLAGEGPLLREIRVAIDRQRERSRWGDSPQQDHAPILEKDIPRLINVLFGLGGLPLHAADLQALMSELSSPQRSLVYLGLDFVRASSAYPKHQALMDALRRSDESLVGMGVRDDETSADPPPDLRPEGSSTIAIHYLAGAMHETFTGDAVQLIHAVAGGHIRSRPGITWEHFDKPCVDLITQALQPFGDPGDDVPVDIAVVAANRIDSRMHVTDRLTPGGMLLLAGDTDVNDVATMIPEEMHDDLVKGNHPVHFVPLPASDTDQQVEPWRQNEALLGGLLALFRSRSGQGKISIPKARAAREAGLTHLPEDERSARLDAFVFGFESVIQVDLSLESTSQRNTSSSDPVFLSNIGSQSAAGSTIDALSKAWDHACVFYREGKTEELSANPYMAVGAIPPLSSTLRDVSGARSKLLVFDPAICDGDSRLWTSCPDGSLVPLVISARKLIDCGIELASAKGKPADTLRGIAGQLAKRCNKIIKSDDPPTTAGQLISQAFDSVVAKMDDADDRRLALKEALEAVAEAIGELPVARTQLFFDEPEGKSPGTGELFSLILNPDACKCPEVIFAECEGHGIRIVKQTNENLETARRLYQLWQQLPDTSGATIERARTHLQIGPLAGIMLSRHCQQAMAGGDGAEPGSGAKLALRHVLGLAEFQLQPRQQKFLQDLDALQSKLNARIESLLSDALPTDDLDALAEGLSQMDKTNVNLVELSRKIDSAKASGSIDGLQLARLVDVSRALADLSWRISEGFSKLGRARCSLVIAPDAVGSWAGAFPYNPFQVPVVIDASGETASLALGLLEGQLRQVLEGFHLLRRANMELDDPSQAEQAMGQQPPLTFSDLTEQERKLCPPMLVIGDGRTFGSKGLSSIAWLMETKLPVKIIVLSGIGGKADGGLSIDSLDGYPTRERIDLALLAMLSRKAFVVQTSIADPDHLAHGILDALTHNGPAFVHVHAPSPERHGFDVRRLFEQARFAIKSRAFPLLRFDPSAEGVFGSCLDLSANPCPTSRWAVDNDESPITPVDWTVSERRYSEHFSPLDNDTAKHTSISEYLDLPVDQRGNLEPSISIVSGGSETRLSVDDQIIADADDRMNLWRTLQELAGVVTPFTKQVRAKAEQELAQSQMAEIAKLTKEHEMRIAQLRAEFEAEATSRVTQGLIALAGYAPEVASSGVQD